MLPPHTKSDPTRKHDTKRSIKPRGVGLVSKHPTTQIVNSRPSIKERVVKHNAERCYNCGLHKWMGKLIVLELHHIDGNNKNNELNNLQLLCPNCHSQTDNWRGRKNKKPV